MKIEKKLIKELVDYLNEFQLSELEYGSSELKIKVSKKENKILTSKKFEASKNIDNEEIFSGTKITSPIIGTAYVSPQSGAKKFVEVGKKIKKGDTVMIVEAMKTMNHVPSTSDGVVKEICVDDGQPVEFDQKIIILE